MQAKAVVDAGVCGFRTTIKAESDDGQSVTFTVESDCGKVRGFAARLTAGGPVDAYQQITPDSPNALREAAQEFMKGCCSACVVPPAAFKAMQVAAGLALPKDIHIQISNT